MTEEELRKIVSSYSETHCKAMIHDLMVNYFIPIGEPIGYDNEAYDGHTLRGFYWDTTGDSVGEEHYPIYANPEMSANENIEHVLVGCAEFIQAMVHGNKVSGMQRMALDSLKQRFDAILPLVGEETKEKIVDCLKTEE